MGLQNTISNKELGKRVKEVRKRYNLTQEQLAEKMGVSPNYVSMIECGTRSLTKEKAAQIIALYPDERIEYLLGIDSFQTEIDALLMPVAVAKAQRDCALDGVSQLAFSLGYNIRCVGNGHPVPLVGFSEREKEMLSAYRGDCVYEITGDNEDAAHIDVDDYECFVNDIREYVEFKITQLCKKSKESADNG